MGPQIEAGSAPVMTAMGQKETSSDLVSDVRFGAVSRPRTGSLRNSRHACPLPSGKQTLLHGLPNVGF